VSPARSSATLKLIAVLSLAVNAALLAPYLRAQHDALTAQPAALPSALPVAVPTRPIDVHINEAAIADRVLASLREELKARLPEPAQPAATRPAAELASEPEAPLPSADQLTAAASAQSRIERVLSQQHFTAQDTTELRQLRQRMSVDDQFELQRQITVAINSGKLAIPDPQLIP